MVDQREQAAAYIKLNGPVIPVQISKVLNTNILFASAVLSELVERKILKMTNAAIGGSKVYYMKGQEPLLGEKLFHALNPIEKEVFTLLKESKVLRDKELEPKERIALRDLKDFAVPLTIKLGNDSEIFWKFHILTDEEVKPLISQYIEEIPEEVLKQDEEKRKAEEINKQEEARKAEAKAQEQARLQQKEDTKIEINDVVAKLKEELMKEIGPKLKEAQEAKVQEKRVEEEKIEAVKVKKKKEAVKEEVIEENKEIIVEEIKEEFVDKTINKKPEGKFYKEIIDFFNESGIKIIKEEMIKKEKEYDFIIKVPSAFGVVSYFVKARDKKTFNDADVSLAYSAGQLKGLPTILLGKGKLNKKAISLIDEKLSGKFLFKEFE